MLLILGFNVSHNCYILLGLYISMYKLLSVCLRMFGAVSDYTCVMCQTTY